MPRNGSGSFSLVAGNPVVSGTTIQSSWANNTLSDVASGLTQSLSRDGQAAMTGPLPMGGQDIQNAGNITASGLISGGGLVPTGSSVPANGWYLPSANTLGVSTNSTQRGTINGTGNWVIPAPTGGIALSLAGVAGAAALAVSGGNGSTVTTGTGTALTVTAGAAAIGMAVVGSGAAAALSVSGGNGTTIGTGSGVALTVTGTSANAVAGFAGTTGAGYIAIFDGQAGTRQWRIGSGQSAVGAFDIVDSTAGNVVRMTINSGANTTMVGLNNQRCLSITGASGTNSPLLEVTGGNTSTSAPVSLSATATAIAPLSLGPTTSSDYYLFLGGNASVGANALTPTWGNFPGSAGTKAPTTWMKVNINGSAPGWIPVFG